MLAPPFFWSEKKAIFIGIASGNLLYPLVNLTYLWKDPPCFMGKFTISMVIFHSYVKLPEGIAIENDHRNS